MTVETLSIGDFPGLDKLVQGTDDWKLARCGKVTASRISDIMAKTKSGPSASRATYMGELIAERLTGVPMETYKSGPMQCGTDTEPQARAAYEFDTDQSVTEVGFVPHPRIAMAGCSPDGITGTDGAVEIKAPLSKTHIETLRRQAIPPEHIPQMQFQMACTGCKWTDFVSFDPRLPLQMRLFVRRLRRDDIMIAEIEAEVQKFIAELDQAVAELRETYGLPKAA
jgi:putative phage-type endonuclease